MKVRHRLALVTGVIVLVTLVAFEMLAYLEIFADPARDNDSVLARVPRAVVLGTLAAVTAAGLAAWLAGTRTLRPVNDIVGAAAQVAEEGDFSRRLSVDPRDPEVALLTGTFNRLIARVDDVLAVQRQLVEDTSHELRTPLTTISGNVELLEHDLSPTERRDVLRETRQELGRMSRLMGDLLLLAEAGPASEHASRPVRLDLLALAARDRVAGAQATRVQVTTEPVVVAGDEDELNQVLANLVHNALRYASSAPGSVQVRVRRDAGDVVLTVEDDGPGIPPDALERVFDRFFRIDAARSRAQGGTGLGLTIVRHIASAHGGQAWAENRPSGGARLVVVLPGRPLEPAELVVESCHADADGVNVVASLNGNGRMSPVEVP